VAYADRGTSADDNADIFLTRSADSGANWTSPLRVNTVSVRRGASGGLAQGEHNWGRESFIRSVTSSAIRCGRARSVGATI